MTTYVSIPNSDTDPESPINTSLMTAYRDNPIAITEGAAGAPKHQTASYTDASVTQAKVAAAAIGTSQLKTTTGELSRVQNGFLRTAVPGGQYGFYPEMMIDGTGETTAISGVVCGAVSYTGTTVEIGAGVLTLTYEPTIMLIAGSAATTWVRQRYIQASPPYDLGDGEIPLFIFLLVDNATGQAVGTWIAEDPPWANNGPTDCRADYYDANGKGYRRVKRTAHELRLQGLNPGREIARLAREGRTTEARELALRIKADDFVLEEVTQATKQADMPLIPHPFRGDISGHTVVLLDPPATYDLLATHEHTSVAKLLHDGYLLFDNVALNRKAPPGVIPVAWRWK